MDEEQQDDIPQHLIDLAEIQQQAQAAREQEVAEQSLAAPPEAAGLMQSLEDIPVARQDPAAMADAPEAQEVAQGVVDAPEAEAVDQKFAEIVGDMNQQAGAVQQVMGIDDLTTQIPAGEFIQPERGKDEPYVAYRNRVREARRQHGAQQRPAQDDFEIRAVPPKLVPAAEIAQQARAAREVDAPPGNAAHGAGPAAAAPGGKVPLDLNPQDLERLTREGEDTADQLVERFRQFIEQTRRFNQSLLSMLDATTAAMAQDHALLEQIRSRFERTREG